MDWIQNEVILGARPRGFHLVTREIEEGVPGTGDFAIGMAHIFIRHTSASLTLNENASPDVRGDLERHLDKMVPEGERHYRHTQEGSDDMPAHIKASLLGSSITIPIRDGRFALGTWQGIYLGEHRDSGGPRRVLVTVWGQRSVDQS
ncbi:secondary thiamine-phosphate synthase enzyme YjbQ [Gemmatimonadota bacterium]